MLWLAVDINNQALGVVEAIDENGAFYNFMGKSIYPAHVIEMPDAIIEYIMFAEAADEFLSP